MNYSTILRRLLAMIIDAIILGLIYLILLVLPFVNNFLYALIALIYHVVFETSSMRGTPGKYWLKISVVNENGDNLTVKQALVRHFAAYISGMFLGLGYVISLFNDRKQTFHDMVAKTAVIKTLQVDLDIIEAFNKQCKVIYNDIKNLGKF